MRKCYSRWVYNDERLHSAIGYIAPTDKLHGREEAIFAERDRKLEAARSERAKLRNSKAPPAQTEEMPVAKVTAKPVAQASERCYTEIT